MFEEANKKVVSTGNVEGAATVSEAHDYTEWPTPSIRERGIGVGNDYWRPWASDGFVVVTDSEEDKVLENFLVMEQMTAEMLEKVISNLFTSLYLTHFSRAMF